MGKYNLHPTFAELDDGNEDYSDLSLENIFNEEPDAWDALGLSEDEEDADANKVV